MVRVITNEEWAAATGKPLAEIEAMIAEVEEGRITVNDMDPSTLQAHNITPSTRERMRSILIQAGCDPARYNL